MKNCKCVIKGRVQGVWFRRYTQNIAKELGVSGFVRNREDGSVEVEASVPDEVLDKFLEALKKGPPLAKVTSFEIFPNSKQFSGEFKVKR
ncbi:MAG: acylphosphatase [Epsilonproteobacteria bacterium]|nr:acylphosphatase [Campylobacterota bacterium]